MPTLTIAWQRHRRRERLKATLEVRWIWRRLHNWETAMIELLSLLEIAIAPVKMALIQDGWVLALFVLRIELAGGKNFFVDLGAKRLIAAEWGVERIAVEVKYFTRP